MSATRLSGFTTTRGSVRVGGELWGTVTVSPRAARAITVQYRHAGTRAFKNASTATTSASGVLTVGLRPPAAGSWQFRAVVPATTRAAKFVSSTRTVVASGRAVGTSVSGFATTATSISLGVTVTDDVDISPRATRGVFVQARRPGSPNFVTQSTGTSTNTGSFRTVYRPTSAGAWGFRLVVRTSATALPVTTPTRIITAVDASVPVQPVPGPVTGLPASGPTDGTANPPAADLSPPGPVTHLQATSVTDSTVALAWTNPADADVTGVVIRRAGGAVAPASVTDGTSVKDLTAPGNTIVDTSLAPATTYSYAVFAHDGAHNYASAAQLTVTTATASHRTVAVLSVRPRGLPANTDNKLTVNTTFRFDAGASLAADGTTLVSGTLDYGDGQTDTFTDPFGPADFWNTEHAYATTGNKNVSLTVTALDGTSDTTTVKVAVLDAPTAVVSVTSGSAQVGQPVTFALNASTVDGTVLNDYILNFSGDDYFHLTGTTAPPTTQDVTFTIPGTYTVAFSVANDAGGYNASVIDILVSP